MLDLFFIIGTILAAAFVLYAQANFSAWGFFIALILFITMGIGLLETGYQTQDNARILIEDLNATATQITFGTTTHNADLSGTAEEQVVFVIGTFYIILGIVFAFLAMQTATENRSARKIATRRSARDM